MVQRTQRKGKGEDQQKVAQFLKKVLSIFGVILISSFGSISSSEAIVDRIVAIVNQEIITLSEVEKWIDPLQKEIQTEDHLERRKRVRELRQKVLERLIEEKLIDHEAKRLGIKVASKEVEAAIEDIKQHNAFTQEDFEKVLAKEGLTFEAFKKQIAKRLQSTKLVNFSVKVEVKAEEKNLRDFYQKNIERYQSKESYRPAHILFAIPKEATSEDIREIRKKCQKVLDKIKGGEDFGEMALLYSEDASSKDRGDLGFFKNGELLPAFEKEALRLQVGEVSGIVRTDFGFHIIKLIDRRGGGSLPFEEVMEKVKADYFEKEMEKAFRQFLTTLREKSVIEIKL
jgi:peptidyl-prolyl cis-trans isomerase SurA